jgi:hypothetical protein
VERIIQCQYRVRFIVTLIIIILPKTQFLSLSSFRPGNVNRDTVIIQNRIIQPNFICRVSLFIALN